MLRITSAGHFQSAAYFSENVTPHRRTRCFELEWLEQGDGFSFIDGVSYPHRPGRLILAKPGQQRFSVGAFSCWYVHFVCTDADEEALLRALADTVYAAPDEQTPICRLLETLATQAHADSAHFAQQATLYALLDAASTRLSPAQDEKAQPQPCASPYVSAVLAVKEYLDGHFGERITLADMAAQAHLSKNYFRVTFCRVMGLSPQAYLSQVRLARAQRLLRDAALPIAQIAVVCGYETQAYMTYVFKRQTGMTPHAYRHAR